MHDDLIATAGYDNKLILWDRRSQRAIARSSHDHLVNQCAFSSDGLWLVSASSDYSARIWAIPSLRLHAVLQGHGDDVDMALFSPDDQYVVTCALDRCVRVFDLDGRCLHTLQGHTGNVLSLAWMKDSRHVLSSSVDGTIRVWDTVEGIQVSVTDLHIRTDSVAIGDDGTVYAGDDHGRIAIIIGSKTHFVAAHRAGVKKIVLNTRQGILVSLSYDRSMVVWRLGGQGRLEELTRSTLPDPVWARAAAWVEDGKIAAGTFGGSYALFDLKSTRWDISCVAPSLAINAVLHHSGRTYSVGDAGTVRIDGQPVTQIGSLCNFLVVAHGRVFTGGQSGQLRDANSGALLYSHHSPLNCGVAFDRGGLPHIAVGSYTGEILIFVVRGGELHLMNELKVYKSAVKGLSSGGGLLFSVCASTEIAWHQIADWTLFQRIANAHERIANACCTIAENQFASVGRDRSLRLWSDGRATVFPSPHPNSIKCIGIDPQRQVLLTGSYGGTLALFDLHNACWRPMLRPTTAGISSICWDAKGEQFLAASYDGSIYTVAP